MIDNKIKNNAVTAYLMIFISITFLVAKNNPKINNDFVKNHTKTAFFIHVMFFIVWLVFSNYKVLNWVPFWYDLNMIISTWLYVMLFWLMLLGIHKASKWEEYSIWNILEITKTWNLVNIKDSKIKEEWKLTIILSYIPFIGYYITSKLYKYNSPILKNIVKINTSFIFFASILWIIWLNNLSSLLILIYIIFVVYSSIVLISNDKLINLNIPYLLTMEKIYLNMKVYKRYIWNYFSKKDFINFNELTKIVTEEYKNENINDSKNLETLKTTFNPILIYIPFINLIYLFQLKTKYFNHIINWILITLMSSIILIPYIDNKLLLLLLFPISFWMWYINKLDYKIPFLYDIFIIFRTIFRFITWTSKKIKDKSNNEQNVSFKVQDKEKDDIFIKYE